MVAGLEVLLLKLLLLLLLIEIHLGILFVHDCGGLFFEVVVGCLPIESYRSECSVGCLASHPDEVAAGDLSRRQGMDKGVTRL